MKNKIIKSNNFFVILFLSLSLNMIVASSNSISLKDMNQYNVLLEKNKKSDDVKADTYLTLAELFHKNGWTIVQNHKLEVDETNSDAKCFLDTIAKIYSKIPAMQSFTAFSLLGSKNKVRDMFKSWATTAFYDENNEEYKKRSALVSNTDHPEFKYRNLEWRKLYEDYGNNCESDRLNKATLHYLADARTVKPYGVKHSPTLKDYVNSSLSEHHAKHSAIAVFCPQNIFLFNQNTGKIEVNDAFVSNCETEFKSIAERQFEGQLRKDYK